MTGGQYSKLTIYAEVVDEYIVQWNGLQLTKNYEIWLILQDRQDHIG